VPQIFTRFASTRSDERGRAVGPEDQKHESRARPNDQLRRQRTPGLPAVGTSCRGCRPMTKKCPAGTICAFSSAPAIHENRPGPPTIRFTIHHQLVGPLAGSAEKPRRTCPPAMGAAPPNGLIRRDGECDRPGLPASEPSTFRRDRVRSRKQVPLAARAGASANGRSRAARGSGRVPIRLPGRGHPDR